MPPGQPGRAAPRCGLALPISIWLLRNFVATMPRELEETGALDGTSWGPIMAASIPYTILPVLFFLIMQRRMVGGLVAGSVKG